MSRNKKPPVTYDNRYRRKLNMLNPGIEMLKWIGALVVVGLVLRLLRLDLVAYFIFGLAGLLVVALVVLLVVEAHQDRVLNDLALQEESDRNGLKHGE